MDSYKAIWLVLFVVGVLALLPFLGGFCVTNFGTDEQIKTDCGSGYVVSVEYLQGAGKTIVVFDTGETMTLQGIIAVPENHNITVYQNSTRYKWGIITQISKQGYEIKRSD